MDKPSVQVALIKGPFEKRTKHAWGYPGGTQIEMPQADVLVLEPLDDGNFMLLRYTAKGDYCGDTWHQSLDEAKQQAAFEFENAVGMWVDAPRDTDAALAYALHLWRSSSAG